MLPSGVYGSATRHAAWWGGDAADGNWQNRVQGIHCDASSILSWWSSTGGQPITLGVPSLVPGSSIVGHDLRNQVSASVEVTDAQCLRLFVDPVANASRVALFTPGARLIVLETGQNSQTIGGTPLEVDSLTNKVLDFGSGGMAMAIGAAREVGVGGTGGTQVEHVVDIYLAPQSFFAASPPPGSTAAKRMYSVVAHLEYVGATAFSSASLRLKQLLHLNGTGGLPTVAGACGMEIGELLPEHAGPELVVGAMDGHLLVFPLDPVTGAIGASSYTVQVEGAVGMYNSIVFADLAPPYQQNELYVAGSLGLRRWVR